MRQTVQVFPSSGKLEPGHLDARNEATPAIRLRDVSKSYSGPNGGELALDRVSFQVDGPGLIAIVGKSGSGKSTLLNLITGIDQPTSGQIEVNGSAVLLLDETSGALWRGRTVGIVFQFFQLIPSLTVLENVTLPMALLGRGTPKERERRGLELLARMDIADQASKLPSSLSGGQQQRCAIARALANEPRLVVADEPTGNLDTATARDVLEILRRLAEEGRTVVVVTHDREIAERADTVLTLRDGRLESLESTTEGALSR